MCQSGYIPPFDHNQVLPPYLENPKSIEELSPYFCSTVELCERFGTTPERRRLLKSLLDFRARLNEMHVSKGFQWLDGSFTEDVELREKRAPRDMDVVTFFWGCNLAHLEVIEEEFPAFIYRRACKKSYLLDHFAIDANMDNYEDDPGNPDLLIESVRYWYGLFSHNRDNVWKGMIRLELNTPELDREALNLLTNMTEGGCRHE